MSALIFFKSTQNWKKYAEVQAEFECGANLYAVYEVMSHWFTLLSIRNTWYGFESVEA